jgi:hypothetical protein
MFLSVIEKPVSTVDSTARYKPGSRYVDASGNEYIYALGVADVAIGTWVALSLETTNNTPITAVLTYTLATATECSLGVAMGAIIADKYGWFQIAGSAEGLACASDAADALQYTSGTDGSLDDGATIDGPITMIKIRGCRLVDTDAGSGGLCTFHIKYPRTAS